MLSSPKRERTCMIDKISYNEENMDITHDEMPPIRNSPEKKMHQKYVKGVLQEKAKEANNFLKDWKKPYKKNMTQRNPFNKD